MDDYLATTSATFTTGARHEFHGPFSLAQARAAGMTEREWRDRALVRATRGVRAPREAHTLQERARVMALAIPEPFAFSHSTAARLWGLPLPAPYEDELTLHVLRGRAIERLGCTGHAGLPSRQTALVRGLPVTSLADTWVDLGELAEPALTRDDLVVIGDAIALALDRALAPVDEDDDAAWADYVAASYDAEQATWSRRAAVGMDAEPAGVTTMREARDRRVRPRGAVLLDSALERVRPRVRSPQETRTRLMFVAAGLPEPETGAQIGTHSGWWGEFDLAWRRQRVAVEYQGAPHGTLASRRSDRAKFRLVEDEGWLVFEVFAHDLRPGVHRRELLDRIGRALKERG